MKWMLLLVLTAVLIPMAPLIGLTVESQQNQVQVNRDSPSPIPRNANNEAESISDEQRDRQRRVFAVQKIGCVVAAYMELGLHYMGMQRRSSLDGEEITIWNRGDATKRCVEHWRQKYGLAGD